MEIEAKYDQLISAPRLDKEGKEVARIEHHHFTLGKKGDKISGGFYIKKGEAIPEELLVKLPKEFSHV